MTPCHKHIPTDRATHIAEHLRGSGQVLVVVLVAGLLLSACSQNRTATAALPDRQETGEEAPHSVPPDRYKDVQYRGGRDPVSGVAPGLDGTVEKSPLPPPRQAASSAKASTKTASAVVAASAPAGKTESGKPHQDDAYRPPAKPISAPAATAPPLARGEPQNGIGDSIVVRPGDTVQSIAQRHFVTVDALLEANNLRSARLVPGQRLRLPD